MKKGFENFGNESAETSKSEKALAIEKLLPPQEERDGFLVNAVENKKIKGEISPEDVEAFIEVMLERIAKELGREHTTLPKDRLQDLEAELRQNQEAVKSIMESFGLGVASDPFALYGLISETKSLMRRVTELYNEVVPKVRYGSAGTTVVDHSDEEISRTLMEFWNSEPVGPDNKGDFPYGEDIQYYSGRDVEVAEAKDDPGWYPETAPGYRYIFGPTRKRKTDYCSTVLAPKNGFSETDIKRMAEDRVQEYALQFRDSGDMVGQKDKKIMRGYPAEWYIPGSNKKKVLEDYFKRYVIPEIKKTSAKRGVR